jgi:hypothetical protein
MYTFIVVSYVHLYGGYYVPFFMINESVNFPSKKKKKVSLTS